jgi:hypothetical protein
MEQHGQVGLCKAGSSEPGLAKLVGRHLKVWPKKTVASRPRGQEDRPGKDAGWPNGLERRRPLKQADRIVTRPKANT